ncbi:MAG: hypothetical protein HPY74_10505 [Firmicutes bacterium]|nr:hypothetical protein [Bacillota bacterium]
MRIDVSIPGQLASESILKTNILKLSTGSIVKAQVVEIYPTKALLKFFSGEIVTASVSPDVNIEKGEILELKVTKSDSAQIVLEKVGDYSNNNDTIVDNDGIYVDAISDNAAYADNVAIVDAVNIENKIKGLISTLIKVIDPKSSNAEFSDIQLNNIGLDNTKINDTGNNIFDKYKQNRLEKVKYALIKLIDILDSQKNSEIVPKLPASLMNSLRQDLEHITNMSNNHIYIQIPIKLSDNTASGDLYIMKRKRKGQRNALDGDDVSAYLLLQLENMGYFKSLIALKQKTTVYIDIEVENKDVQAFLKENYKYIYANLLEKGYRLANIKSNIRESNKIRIKDGINGEIENKENLNIDIKI